MVCAKCGAEIKEGHLYCEKCGTEIQIVPDFEAEIEESIQNTMAGVINEIESSDTEGVETVTEGAPSGEVPGTDAGVIIEAGGGKLNKFRLILICVIGLVFVSLTAYGISRLVKFSSYNYQYNKALEEYTQGNYTESVETLKHALRLNSKEEKTKLLLSDNYFALKKYDESIATLLDLKSRFPHDYTIYDRLVDVYMAMDDYASIASLAKDSSDEVIMEKYGKYIVEPPTFDMEEGEYEDSLTLRLFSEVEGNIYYTLDGSVPDINSKKYDAPIYMVAGNITVSAVFVNESGIVSEPVSKKYTIVKYDPVKPSLNLPVVKTAGGDYSTPTFIEANLPEELYMIDHYEMADYNDSSNPVNAENAGDNGGNSNKYIDVSDLKVKLVYTTDGTDPTFDSTEYTGVIPMPLTKKEYRFALCDEEGDSSEIISETYNLKLVTMFDIPTCKTALQYYLITFGRTTLACDFTCDSAVSLIGRNMYLFYETEGGKKTGNTYGVDVMTGDLFTLDLTSPTGNYTAYQLR